MPFKYHVLGLGSRDEAPPGVSNNDVLTQGLYALTGQTINDKYSKSLSNGSYTLSGQTIEPIYLCAEALAWAAACATPPSAARLLLMSNMIVSLKTANAWPKLDLFYVCAAHAQDAALLNVKSPGTFTLTAINSPTFTTDGGFTGNGAGGGMYLDTAWDSATNGVQFTQNSAHIGVYMGANNINADFGTGTSQYTVVSSRNTTNAAVRVTSTTQLGSTNVSSTTPRHTMGIRRNSTDVYLWRDGAQDNTNSIASSALTTVDFNLLRVNNQFKIAGSTIHMAHCGAQFSDPEGAAFYAAVHTYMVAIGADT